MIEREEEEKIINIRIYSDDFLKLFGLMTIMTNDFHDDLKPIAKDILYDIADRITDLNKKNREFIETVE